MHPTVNVNPKPCSPLCEDLEDPSGPYRVHASNCRAAPVLIPCPLPPPVSFEVVLGECDCPAKALPGASVPHRDYCPARPVKVSCSISGKTWEESAVGEGYTDTPSGSLASLGRELDACRERWALVKALVLVLGKTMSLHWSEMASPGQLSELAWGLFAQRDTVYTALVDVVQHEDGLFQRGNDALRAINGHSIMRPAPDARESALTLGIYVERLIQQVGAL